MQVVGYADTYSVEPGAEIGFMISSHAPRFRAGVIRLLHGDTNPAGPGFKSQAIESDVSGEHPGRVQVIRPGSYVRVPHAAALEPHAGFTLQMWIQATTPGKQRQTLIAKTGADGGGYELWLDAGRPALSAMREGRRVAELSLGHPLVAGIWYFVAAVHDADARGVKGRPVLDEMRQLVGVERAVLTGDVAVEDHGIVGGEDSKLHAARAGVDDEDPHAAGNVRPAVVSSRP